MVSKELENGIITQAKVIEAQLVTVVQNTLEFAIDVKESVDAIKDNTKKLFFWTSTLVVICLGLFILDQLVKLRRQLTTLNEYQSAFYGMWQEDKQEERLARKYDRRERLLEDLRKTHEMAGGGGPFPLSLPQVNSVLDSAPPPGTAEWDEFIDEIYRRAMQHQAEQWQ
ncbi:hypothetical protein F4775DRAFT_587460 [Biscogniauxia sp. FL1348]|nr:hypothetical protein F4775DRAFT_587460 [Biscogniauxia sp. FL1348]